VSRSLFWLGLDEPLAEVAHVDADHVVSRVRGTQIGLADGSPYELRYAIDGERLEAEVVGRGRLEHELGDGEDFFDVAASPFTNTFPVARDGLHRGGEPRDYVMAWVDVPSLRVHRSEQRYEPLEPGLVRFRSGSFTADIEFDDDGFVVLYPGLAKRVL
jgi:uncharacterized protein